MAHPPDRFAGLYDRYYRNILRYALQHADQGSAEDVASEVFLIAWRQLPAARRQPPAPAASPSRQPGGGLTLGPRPALQRPRGNIKGPAMDPAEAVCDGLNRLSGLMAPPVSVGVRAGEGGCRARALPG